MAKLVLIDVSAILDHCGCRCGSKAKPRNRTALTHKFQPQSVTVLSSTIIATFEASSQPLRIMATASYTKSEEHFKRLEFFSRLASGNHHDLRDEDLPFHKSSTRPRSHMSGPPLSTSPMYPSSNTLQKGTDDSEDSDDSDESDLGSSATPTPPDSPAASPVSPTFPISSTRLSPPSSRSGFVPEALSVLNGSARTPPAEHGFTFKSINMRTFTRMATAIIAESQKKFLPLTDELRSKKTPSTKAATVPTPLLPQDKERSGRASKKRRVGREVLGNEPVNLEVIWDDSIAASPSLLDRATPTCSTQMDLGRLHLPPLQHPTVRPHGSHRGSVVFLCR
ncbi:hypothetical protein A0H81_05860 [Grifola frondosa]|uniref:Uncharacterized protein n=1 Tax=Grifola frondosa TaxID=5627 RepID=A0A1C7M9V1_GRIFR|nr:hypothetical protein A0H81_05860 [Grifola frondosa]